MTGKLNQSALLLICGFAVLLSVYITYSLHAGEVILLYDTRGYYNLGKQIAEDGFRSFSSVSRTYGYPAFLAIWMRLNDWLPFSLDDTRLITHVQFVLHTLTAVLTVYVLRRLRRIAHPDFSSVLCFAIIQLTLPLLSLTQELTNDSLSVFLLTAFLAAALSPLPFAPFLASTFFALAIVVRPFYGPLLVGMVAVVAALKIGSWLWRRQAPRLNRRALVVLGQVILPMMVIVGAQYWFVYSNEGRVDLVPGRANADRDVHLAMALYMYKYETYNGSLERSPELSYINPDVEELVIANDLSLTTFVLGYPLQALEIYAVKTITMFQSFEWSSFRESLDNPVNIFLLNGFIFFAAFVYINYLALSRTFQRENPLPFPALLIVLLIDLHIVLYSIFSTPESRYAAPVLPAILAVALAYRPRTRRGWMIFALLTGVSALLFAYCYLRLQVTMV